MPDFNEFSRATLNELQTLVTQELQDHAQEAIDDANAFLRRTQADLNRWLLLLGEGKLSPDDLGWLLQGKKDLGKMQALKQAGVSQARINKFQGAIVTAAVTAAATGMQVALSQAQIPQIPAIPSIGKAKSRSGPPAPRGRAASKAKATKKSAAKKAPTRSKAKSSRR